MSRVERTIVVGALAMFGVVTWLALDFGMDPHDLLEYALTSALLVLGMMIVAVVGVTLLWGIRKLLRRR